MNDSINIDLSDTETIIKAFGGIRPMASKLDVPVSTVQGWKQRGVFPKSREGDIINASKKLGIDIENIKKSPEKTDELIEGRSNEVGREKTSYIRENPKKQRKLSVSNLLLTVLLIISLVCVAWLVLGERSLSPGGLSSIANETLTKRIVELEAVVNQNGNNKRQQKILGDIKNIRDQLDKNALKIAQSEILSNNFRNLMTRLENIEISIEDLKTSSVTLSGVSVNDLREAKDEIASIQDKLANLESSGYEAKKARDKYALLALLIGILKREVEQGYPYQMILSQIQEVDALDSDIRSYLDEMAAKSRVGVQTKKSLIQEYPDLIKLLLNSNVNGPAKDWVERGLRKVRGIVTIRKIGSEVPGQSLEAVIARSEAYVAKGNLEAAAQELMSLKGAAATISKSWIAAVNYRISVDSTLRKLEKHIINKLKPNTGGT
ncbi:MAG: hypothetical protein CL568_07895 [Alphaproteobacteria bacterium]|jgi:hypothetical protein|nr:hypothetical protein [Alphaproteobacteria bacterium]PPR14005.1 MAG: hypothetical protein CFH42_00872 [Alphaproteobacteria bacterium MarineAlpha12_Bin1]|tara:strand:+ start:2179 stop:3483 length:1305 start_codon:yes stop_codon:yes gene_type:complete